MQIKLGKNVMICGFVPRDADYRQTTSGTSICSISVKVDNIKNDDGTFTAVWATVVGWREVADAMRYVIKGDRVLCLGVPQTRTYTTREGEERTVTELVCDYFCTMDKFRNTAPAQPMPIGDGAPVMPGVEELDDAIDDSDLPF